MTDSSRSVGITICSSYRPFDEPYIRLNFDLVRYLNEQSNWKWVIADNGVVEGEKALEIKDGRFSSIEGIPISSVPNQEPPYRHAAVLKKIMQGVDSRFVLVLDPDCYMVQRNWVDRVMQYMINEELAFFGLPWHPRWYSKYRYFPCAHGMFIDLERVSAKDLDFSPKSAAHGKNRIEESVRSLVPSRWRPLLRTAAALSGRGLLRKAERTRITRGSDIGDNVFRDYGRNRLVDHRLTVPVFDLLTRETEEHGRLKSFGDMIERWLPDRWSYVPKKKGYFTRTGFRESGFPDVRSYGWEEYMWEGKPFAFHLRRIGRAIQDQTAELPLLNEAVQSIRTSETR